MLYDRDIREPLFDFLVETNGKIRILEEKIMGKSRADAVMVTVDALYGIEIKSDADTYARLARQTRDYDLYYDYNYAVVGTSHALHIEEHLPAWWGIITVEPMAGGPDFYILRRPRPSPKMDRGRKISILWRPELAHIQALNGLPAYREKSKTFVQNRLLERVPEKTLQRQMCDALFERDYTAIEEQIRQFRAKRQKQQPEKGRRKRRRRGTGGL